MITRTALVLATALLLLSPARGQTLASKVVYLGNPYYVAITGLTTRQHNGMLTLFLDVTNSDNGDRGLYYRVAWLDADGLPAWAEETWKPVLLHGKQVRTLQISAPTPKALDFKIEVNAPENWSGSQSPPQY